MTQAFSGKKALSAPIRAKPTTFLLCNLEMTMFILQYVNMMRQST